MVFPIVTGSKQSSSRPLFHPSSSSSAGSSNSSVTDTPTPDAVFAVGVNSNGMLQATLTVSYRDVVTSRGKGGRDAAKRGAGGRSGDAARDNDVTNVESTSTATTATVTTVAELRVEVTKLADPFRPPSTGECRCRVPLRTYERRSQSSSAEASASASASTPLGDEVNCRESGDEETSRTTGNARRRRRRPRHNAVSADVVFSSDDRHLACLVPHPPLLPLDVATTPPSLSTVVVFRLRSTRYKTRSAPPPLPSWAASAAGAGLGLSGTGSNAEGASVDGGGRSGDGTGPESVPAPHDPKIVRIDAGGGGTASSLADRGSLSHVTAICDASSAPSPSTSSSTAAASVLLAGCNDGSILAVGYRRARLAGALHRPSFRRDGDDHGDVEAETDEEGSADEACDDNRQSDEGRGRGVVHLSQCPPALLGSLRPNGGRIAATRRDGRVEVYGVSYVPLGAPASSQSTKAAVSGGDERGRSAETLAADADDSTHAPSADADTMDAPPTPTTPLVRPGRKKDTPGAAETPGREEEQRTPLLPQGGARLTPLSDGLERANDSGGGPDWGGLPPPPLQALGHDSGLDDSGVGDRYGNGDRDDNCNGCEAGPMQRQRRDDGDGRDNKDDASRPPSFPPPPRVGREADEASTPSTPVTERLGRRNGQRYRPRHGGVMMRIDLLITLGQEKRQRRGECSGEGVVPRFVRSSWVGGDAVALLARPPRSDGGGGVMAQVWAVQDDGVAEILSTLRMTADKLAEGAHGSFSFGSGCVGTDGAATVWCSNDPLAFIDNPEGHSSLQYDPQTNCIAIGSHVLSFLSPTNLVSCEADGRSNGNVLGSDPSNSKSRRPVVVRPFVCIWDWRCSVLGLTLVGDTYCSSVCLSSGETSDIPPGLTFRLSRLQFGHDGSSGPCIAHLYATHLNTAELRLRKDLYHVGLLSPSGVAVRRGCTVEEACPLLLSSHHVTFPFLSKPLKTQDCTIEWKESRIPTNYTSANGPASIATMGRLMGRSIAVASARGVCIADLSRMWGVWSNCSIEEEKESGTLRRSSRQEKANKVLSPCAMGSLCSPLYETNALGKMMRSFPKWRIFGSETEEQGFRVVAMTWWERSFTMSEQATNLAEGSSSEDLLVAVIEYVPTEKASLSSASSNGKIEDSPLFLVCWSRKRLGMGHLQLLEQVSDANSENDLQKTFDQRQGIPLPKGLKADSISLLADPSQRCAEDDDILLQSSRALVFISSTHLDGSGCGVEYAAYQLHAICKEDDVQNKKKTCRVLSRLSSRGRIPLKIGSKSSMSSSTGVASVFLAGGSFQFDLSRSNPGVDLVGDEFIATLGIVRAFGGGLDAVSIASCGPVLFGPQAIPGAPIHSEQGTDTISSGRKGTNDIATFWISDIIVDRKTTAAAAATNTPGCRQTAPQSLFVWTLCCNDGKVFSWSVPFFGCGQKQIKFHLKRQRLRDGYINGAMSSWKWKGSTCPRTRGDHDSNHALENSLHPPDPIDNVWELGALNGIAVASDSRSVLGMLCCVGDSSVWMNGAATSDNEVAIGPLPHSPFGCVLYAGQRSRKIEQPVPRTTDAAYSPSSGQTSKDTLNIEMFCVGECMVSAPSYTASLLTSLLIAAAPGRISAAAETSSKLCSRLGLLDSRAAARDHAKSIMQRNMHEDTIMMALRVIIMRTIDFLSDISDTLDAPRLVIESLDVSERESAHWLAKSLLFEVVSAVNVTFGILRLSSLFLGIGRQMEPHHFSHLFPLPNAPPSAVPDVVARPAASTTKHSLRTVESLFIAACMDGSVSIAASALPLLSSKHTSHEACAMLLSHCLRSVVKHYHPNDTASFVLSTEERHLLNQLFWFGIKLEDAADVSNGSIVNQLSDIDSRYDDEISSVATSSSVDSRGSGPALDGFGTNSLGSSSYSETDFTSHSKDDPTLTPSRKKNSDSRFRFSHFLTVVSPLFRKQDSEKDILDENEIYRAASSFIISGFDDFDDFKDHLTTSDATPENDAYAADETRCSCHSNLPHSAVSCGPLVTNSSMAGIVAKFAVSLALSVSGSDRYNWRRLSLVAKALQGDKAAPSMYSAESANAVKLSIHLIENDLKEVVLLYNNDSSGDSDKDTDTQVVSFLVRHILECAHQIQEKAATSIFNLILLVLMRYEQRENAQRLQNCLVLLGIMCGHVAGRVHEILGPSPDDSFLGKLYSVAATEVEKTV